MRKGLSIVRGTTNTYGLEITKEGKPYTLETGQVLVFGLKKKATDEERLLVKPLTSVNGEYYLELTPADTENLESGTYSYDVGLQHGDAIFYNVIEASSFEIKPNVTRLGDGS